MLILLTSFIICLATQCFYFLKFNRLLYYTAPPPGTNQPLPVSIVIAAKNEESNLPRLLEALIRQEYGTFEIIIINDCSTDSTSEVIRKYAKRSPIISGVDIAQVPTGWNSKKYALSQGIYKAKHPIILLTDADCIPKSDFWIKKIACCFDKKTDFVLGFSPYEKSGGLLNQWIQFETLYTGIQYLSSAINGNPYMGVGRNLAYRKKTFSAHGFKGYAHVTGGDDDIFVNRHANLANTNICISEEAHTLSKPKNNWTDYFKQKIRHLSVGKYYHPKDQTGLALFTLSHWVGWSTFFSLLMANFQTYLILVLLCIRGVVFYTIFTRIGQKLQIKLIYGLLPIFEIIHSLLYPIVGLYALMSKKIKWK